MTPTDFICEVKRYISTKEAENKTEKAYIKVYKSDGTNTVLSHAFPSTFMSQHCFLR